MKKIIALMLALMLVLCGCGGSGAETEPSTTAPVETTAPVSTPETTLPTEETTEPATDPTESAPVDVNPLTGEALDEVNNNRIIAVMINNSKKALPQCGIGQADIIYEILAEGSTTRLMALFTDTTDAGAIGPVRSLRAYYLNIMRGYGAICTSAGGSTEADNMVRNLGYNRINGIAGYGANYFYRDTWRKDNRGYEHSLFITGENLLKAAEACGFETTTEDKDHGLTFTDEPFTAGDAAEQIVIYFYSGGKTTTMSYSAADGYYTGYQQGYDMVDGNTDALIPFENVLILFADSAVIDGEGHMRVQTTGEGSGYYARDGRMIEIKWERDDDTSDYAYYDTDGNPITFGVGKSYIAIIPKGCPVETLNAAAYEE